jgi:hypothetical protein
MCAAWFILCAVLPLSWIGMVRFGIGSIEVKSRRS